MKCPACSRAMKAVTARDPERAWFCDFCRQHRDKTAMEKHNATVSANQFNMESQSPDTDLPKETK